MDTESQVYIIQILSCVILLLMYIPQIYKTYKVKSVSDISMAFVLSKFVMTILTCVVMELANNSFIAIAAQYLSLILGGITLVQMFHYNLKEGNHK